MKKLIILWLTLSVTLPAWSQPLKGAWKLQSGDNTALIIATEDYLVVSSYNIPAKTFENSWGGKYILNGEQVTVDVEFNTGSIATVGTLQTYILKLKKKNLELDGAKFEKMDEGKETALAGLWRITSRADQNGNMNPMGSGARKTLKIISGTRFQWFAINPMSKEFFGTGGGTYTLKNGKYTETIEYFPRDSTRVGVSLTFDAEVKPTEWIHSGKSSKGDPIKEGWTKQ